MKQFTTNIGKPKPALKPKVVLTYSEQKRLADIQVAIGIMSMLVLELHEEASEVQKEIGYQPTKIASNFITSLKAFAEANNSILSTNLKNSTIKQDLENKILYHVSKFVAKNKL